MRIKILKLILLKFKNLLLQQLDLQDQLELEQEVPASGEALVLEELVEQVLEVPEALAEMVVRAYLP